MKRLFCIILLTLITNIKCKYMAFLCCFICLFCFSFPYFFTEGRLPANLVSSWHSDVVTTPWFTLSQRCGIVENGNCADISFRRCQDVATTLLQRRHNIKHGISGPFSYELF